MRKARQLRIRSIKEHTKPETSISRAGHQKAVAQAVYRAWWLRGRVWAVSMMNWEGRMIGSKVATAP